MVVEKFYFGGTEYTSAVTKARLYMKRGGGIDYGTLTLSRATTDTIGAISNGDAFQFRRTVTTNATVMFRGVIESIEIDDINYYKVKVVAETESYQRTEITDSWSSTNLEAILQDIDDGTGVTVDWQWTEIAIDSLALDKINKWDAIKQLSYMACITYWNDHKADTLVFHFPSGNDESPDLGTFVTGTHIIGVPKWETTNEHILNSVTVVYSGGSVQGQDATSIAAYGLHERTLNRLLLTDYDDAVTLANLVPTLYKDPIITAKFKIVKGICGEDGSGYENFPLGYHIDIDDNINYSDTKTSYHVDELTINYPEKYDEMVCSVRGVRGSLTDAYIKDQGTRIELVERNVDQNVTVVGGPTFATVTLTSTAATALDCAGGLDVEGASDFNSSLSCETLVVDSTGSSAIGIGGDCNLYRSAANTLKTDDGLYSAVAVGISATTFMEEGSMNEDAQYIIYKSGSNTEAKNGATGDIAYSNASANTVITAVKGAVTSGRVYIKAGTYDIDTLDLSKNDIEWILDPGVTLTGRITLIGTETATTTTLTANGDSTDVVISVTDASGFTAGDFIKIEDSGVAEDPPGTGASYDEHMEGNVIKSISVNDITLETGLNNNYTTANGAFITLVTPVENVTIRGGIIHNDVTRYTIYGYWTKNIKLEGIKVLATPDANDGVYFACTWHSTFTDMEVYDTHDGINLEVCACYNVIENATSHDNEADGIDLALYAMHNKIINCTCFNNIASGVRIEWYSDYNEVIGGSRFGNVYGVDFHYGNHNQVIGGSDYNNTYGICAHPGSYNLISGGKAFDNRKISTSRGIYILGDPEASSYNEITDMEVFGNSEHGILLSMATDYCSVHDNMVHDNGVDSANADGIVVATDGDNNEIYNNIVWNHTRDEIRIHDSGCANNRIFDNVLWGSHTAALVDNGTTTEIKRNKGYVTENSGTATIANGTAAIVVNHGLATTPTVVTAVGSHAEVISLYVGTFTATQFTATTAVGNTSANRTIYWYAEV